VIARGGILAAAIATLGCTSWPAAPAGPPAGPVAAATAGPAPSVAPATPDPRHPLGPPEAAGWVFGAVDEVWRVERERVALYDVRERLAGKPPGTMTATYLRLGGVVYGVHWDDAAKAAALAPGATANLYVAENVACAEDASHPLGTRCWRLMHVFPGRRAQPPLRGT
jgi:hypothetical protein